MRIWLLLIWAPLAWADLPENSLSIAGTAICPDGYVQTENACQATAVPENATPLADGWKCNIGFEQDGASCVALDSEASSLQVSQEAQRLVSEVRIPVNETFKTLAEVERDCRVSVLGHWQPLECGGAQWHDVERHCAGLPGANLACTQPQLVQIERCRVRETGTLSCQLERAPR